MKLLIFSDIHGYRSALERLTKQEADYYFSAGDLSNFGRGLDAMGEILKSRADRVYSMPGNHESVEDNQRFCEKFGLHDVHGQLLTLDACTVAGLGCSNITPFQTPGEYSEDELTSHLSLFSGKNVRVLVCHCPPKDTTLDRAGQGRHFGSPAVRTFLDHEQPAYFFCGHIHEAAGQTDRIGATLGMNVGKRGSLLEIA
ncbi:MAG: metallophosphoesterase [Acidobacteriaceae bacterium]|nr:metallophosphoesterase [Acidobacteriaceae bacterium]